MQKLKLILAIGIFLRIALSLITYHSDVAVFPFVGKVIGSGNVSNFYDYLWDLPESAPELSVYPRNLFNYPPSVYFTLGGASILTSLPVANFVDDFIYNFEDVLGDFRLNVLLLLTKLPYLIFDFGALYFFLKLFKTDKQKHLALLFWVFNPVNLYATYMMGMYEIIPVFFVVFSMYLTQKNKSLIPAALALGAGAAFKIFPILFLVPLASLRMSWIERIKIISAGCFVYLISILPFIGSSGFRRTALLAGQTTKSLYLNFPISGGEAIFPFLVLILLFYLIYLFKKGDAENIWKRYFTILLIFFSLTHYHPQWFLWITPFIILDLVRSSNKHLIVVLIALFSFFGLVTFFDPGLSIGLFSPVNPQLYRSPGIWELLGINFDINYARSILQTLFVAAALYWGIYHFKESQG